ncbi:MAG: ornithine cyclodeaminase family protein [Terriglobia bacterium]|jgi:ornithine cyclodeaminase/alanine dehydrogenase-like protein (mu-crystallin family)
MTLFLTESDVRDLLPMDRALECVEASFVAQGNDRAINRSRERILLPHTSLHYMAGALPESQHVGMKIYTVTPEDVRFLLLLFDTVSGRLLSLMQADYLGRLRTGAASGIATKYLARPDASRAAVMGTGRQAHTQLQAIARVRKLTAVKAFGRDANRLQAFCREMSEEIGVPVEPASSAEEAIRFGEIVSTATTAQHPVVLGEYLQPGTHINAIGANTANRRELDDEAVRRAALIAVDSVEQSRKESGDLIQGLANLGRGWESVIELHSVVAGKHPGRSSADQITLFKSHGIALWDVAVAGFIYQQALQQGKGRELEID